MTEPLFLGLVGGLALFVVRWRLEGRTADLVAAAVLSGLACLVRYEAWPIAAAAAVVACGRDWRSRAVFTRWAPLLLGVGLVGPVLLFGLHTWIATERGLLRDRRRQPHRGARERHPRRRRCWRTGSSRPSACPWPSMAASALALIVVRRRDPVLAMAAACAGPAVVTFTAYLAGHPTKARYALLLAPAFALALAAVTRGPAHRAGRRARSRGAAARRGARDPSRHPGSDARPGRRGPADGPSSTPSARGITAERLLASMGSTAPVLFETGLPLREVVHEGNGHYWANRRGRSPPLRRLGAGRRRRHPGPGPHLPAGVPGGVRPRLAGRVADALRASGRFGRRQVTDEPLGREAATRSRAPGSSNRWDAPGTISSRTGAVIRAMRLAVHADDGHVVAADDEQGRGEDARAARGPRGRAGRRGRPRPGRAPDGPRPRPAPPRRPCWRRRARWPGFRCPSRASSQSRTPASRRASKRDVEAQVAGGGVDPLLVGGEQVDEQRGQACALQRRGHRAIARAVAAAARAVGEEHQRPAPAAAPRDRRPAVRRPRRREPRPQPRRAARSRRSWTSRSLVCVKSS